MKTHTHTHTQLNKQQNNYIYKTVITLIIYLDNTAPSTRDIMLCNKQYKLHQINYKPNLKPQFT